jgi:hypothetical protein
MIYFSVAKAVKFIFYEFLSRIVASSSMHLNRHTTTTYRHSTPAVNYLEANEICPSPPSPPRSISEKQEKIESKKALKNFYFAATAAVAFRARLSQKSNHNGRLSE